MNPASKHARIRSLAGLLLGLALLPLLLGVLACLPAPVGDPERARVNPKLAGAWFGAKDDHGILILEPFDKRCYLATWIEPEFKTPESGSKPERTITVDELEAGTLKADSLMVMKTWLTDLGGTPFLCMEPKLSPGTERGFEPEAWFVWKMVFDGKDGLSLHLVDQGHPGFKSLKKDTVSRKQVEGVIRKNLKDPALYSERDDYRRIPQSSFDALAKLLQLSGIETR